MFNFFFKLQPKNDKHSNREGVRSFLNTVYCLPFVHSIQRTSNRGSYMISIVGCFNEKLLLLKICYKMRT